LSSDAATKNPGVIYYRENRTRFCTFITRKFQIKGIRKNLTFAPWVLGIILAKNIFRPIKGDVFYEGIH